MDSFMSELLSEEIGGASSSSASPKVSVAKDTATMLQEKAAKSSSMPMPTPLLVQPQPMQPPSAPKPVFPNNLPTGLVAAFQKLNPKSVPAGALKATAPVQPNAVRAEPDVEHLRHMMSAACCDLDVGGYFQSLTMAACAGSTLENLPDDEIEPIAAKMASQHRPRAGSRSLVNLARSKEISGPLLMANVNFVWSAPISDKDTERPTKRAKTEAGDKVRVRHILLGYVGAVQPKVPGKKKVTRTAEEAEQKMLEVLGELDKEPTQFTAKCRELSECQSSLKGGELAGDLGWLSRDKPDPKSIQPEVHKAAFTLAIGQLSDMVFSRAGVHLLIRTA
eukprot:TRINITY_DN12247_c0_g2_i1.p1 TRINITY_DN12247_c0_g2~~TRINITY_DN12247_c0_g2_i1.p1  ORF type:complete len:355 (+),score=81.05 TRINITY_DN12247_c0_g2_i1:61-1065(+)